MTPQQKGLLLTFIGAMVLTFDTPTIRLLDGPQWPVLFWRMALLVASLMTFWLIMKVTKRSVSPLINGKSGLAVSVLYSIGNITFIGAIYNTNVANVVFILALTPVLAAFFSFIWFREKIGIDTVLALIVALAGVGIIVWHGLAAGTVFGDLLASTTATTMALALTITRRVGKDMSMTPIVAGLFTATIAFFMSGDLFTGLENWQWLAINGLIIMPLSYSLLALGPKYIPATEVALFFLLETVLAPIWVWFAVGEKVSASTLFGGAVILLTLLLHSLYRLKVSKKRIALS